LVGGPPCQPFSKSGYWAAGDARRLDDPRAGTLRHFFRVLRDTLPEAFILENVPGLKYEGKDEGLQYLRRKLQAINRETGSKYVAEVAQLNAAHYGVPQMRERVFVVAHREGRRFRFPPPTHVDPDKCDQLSHTCFRVAWDAIGDLKLMMTRHFG